MSRLQPRTIGQLLDGGFEVLRFRFRTIAVVAASVVLPLYALPQILIAAFGDVPGVGSLDASSNPILTPSGQVTGDFWTTIGMAYLAGFGLMLATMLMGVAVAHLVSAWLVGADPTAADTLRFLRSRLPTALGAFALASLIKVPAALVCGVGLVYVLPALSVLAPIVAAEGSGAGASIGRSFRLTRRRFGPVLGVSALWLLASALLSNAASGVAAIAGELITGSDRVVDVAAQSVDLAATMVLTVVQVSVTALLYVDLRVRTEGLDLELESVERFGAPVR